MLHAAGRRDYDDLRRRLDELGSPQHYRLFAYIEPFADALAAADLAAARAGGSVFELAAAGLPSILVPYPHATGDHQDANARFMEKAGAAIVIPDASWTARGWRARWARCSGRHSAWRRWRTRRARWRGRTRRSGWRRSCSRSANDGH